VEASEAICAVEDTRDELLRELRSFKKDVMDKMREEMDNFRQMMKNEVRTEMEKQQLKKKPTCGFCNKIGHSEDNCWAKNGRDMSNTNPANPK
jgi:hypothetical protein